MNVFPPITMPANATHANAVASITGVPGKRLLGQTVQFGYSAAPGAGATLVFKSGATVLSTLPVIAGGAFSFDIQGLASKPGDALSATLSDGGAGIIGYVTLNAQPV